jgi:hypothetical protein
MVSEPRLVCLVVYHPQECFFYFKTPFYCLAFILAFVLSIEIDISFSPRSKLRVLTKPLELSRPELVGCFKKHAAIAVGLKTSQNRPVQIKVIVLSSASFLGTGSILDLVASVFASFDAVSVLRFFLKGLGA